MKDMFIICAVVFWATAAWRVYRHRMWEHETARWLAKRFGRSGPDGADLAAAEDWRKKTVWFYLLAAAGFSLGALLA